MNHATRALLSGAAGAVALTSLHELVRQRVSYAPRMDVLAKRGFRALLPAGASARIDAAEMHQAALAGDLISNALYYAAIPASTASATWARALVLGTAAGAGALWLPERIGLGTPPHKEVPANRVMTMAWYLAGAIVAALTARALQPRETSPHAA